MQSQAQHRPAYSAGGGHDARGQRLLRWAGMVRPDSSRFCRPSTRASASRHPWLKAGAALQLTSEEG